MTVDDAEGVTVEKQSAFSCQLRANYLKSILLLLLRVKTNPVHRYPKHQHPASHWWGGASLVWKQCCWTGSSHAAAWDVLWVTPLRRQPGGCSSMYQHARPGCTLSSPVLAAPPAAAGPAAAPTEQHNLWLAVGAQLPLVVMQGRRDGCPAISSRAPLRCPGAACARAAASRLTGHCATS